MQATGRLWRSELATLLVKSKLHLKGELRHFIARRCCPIMKASTWLYVALLLAAMILFRFLLLHAMHRRVHHHGARYQSTMNVEAA
jgi:hypothetical protein